MNKHDQIHQAFQRIIEEATPSTPSGSHKVFVVGQLVVNVHGEGETYRGDPSSPRRECCGKCHN